MVDILWSSGPPPSLGWWPTSFYTHDAQRRNAYFDTFRWYNGKAWSVFARRQNSAREAAEFAKITLDAENQFYVLWARRPRSWPARSRT